MLKQINELKDGKCIVVASLGDLEKRFEGDYCEKLKIVFMAIPSTYEIKGYIQ